jgi:hypothetical protein
VLLLELIVKSRRLTKDFCASRPRCKKKNEEGLFLRYELHWATLCANEQIGQWAPRPREILKVEAPGMHATYMTAWHIVNDQSEK